VKYIKTRIKHGTNRGVTATKAGRAAAVVGGFTYNDFKKALSGDKETLKKIGEIEKENQMFEVAFLSLSRASLKKIENEKDLNLFVAEYVKKGSEAANAIHKAKQQTRLATVVYENKRDENVEQFKGAWELEKSRHKFTIDYNRAKTYVDLVLQYVDGEVAVLDQRARLKLRQMNEDRNYAIKTSAHYLEHGEEANLELIQKKDYSQTAGLFQRLGRGIKNLIGV
jgi:hypothetical protein